MQKVLEALDYLASLIGNYKQHSESLNYEDEAKKGFKEKGRGFISVEASNFVRTYLEGESQLIEINHQYVTLDAEGIQEGFDSENFFSLIRDYDPSTEYVVVMIADRDRLPAAVAAETTHKLVYGASVFRQSEVKRPSNITPAQIKKRLNRMVQEKVRLVVLDTRQPDYMGDNLGKWLREIKKLEYRGKHLSVIIDSNEEFVANIPDNLQGDIATITFKNS